ncbi:hypothetical protein B5S28_g2140 [[Candida] boidinii]|uniref:Unnamed protein product n=1 Tax=Candida boidinii TaxID=5477 RepID=A0ACB5TRB6_CANBO|nr:hypothetical protein B5S28_g2140 [[Candida] boidinii]OWB60337.1 hypothetical protein B5S29_g1210 [[Candida] boidinii]OWB72609.1 hypothetical protein B5S31_g2326 [[Candida] boidinii]OWB76635.1 hypothetical protein B5S32_g789 [[Candida] boidinii]GME93652.1 unnamed protein product [[Candida] boidinii]
MRSEVYYIILAHAIVVLFLVYQTFDLITLLYDDSFQDALLVSELNTIEGLEKPQLIPKIIHQTYKTTNVPEIWKAGQQRCIDLHPDYQYILWTDEMSRDFIAEEYPWFLSTFDGYKFPIERADAIRYFVLDHFGGVYIDLDDGCAKRLDPLLSVPAFVRKTIPTGISNDVMGSVPQHPFFKKTIASLKKYDRNWLAPYITIMYSTGPLFLSVVWKQYKRWGLPESGKVRILMPQEYKSGNDPFFTIAKGSSWHQGDAKFLFILSNHIPMAIVGGFLIAFTFLFLEYLLYCLVISNSFKRFFKGIFNLITLKNWSHNNYSSLNNTSLNNSINGNSKKSKRVSRFLPPFKKTRNRKDSNLPSKIDIDLEKNVIVTEDITE